jgi:hypothetical protein
LSYITHARYPGEASNPRNSRIVFRASLQATTSGAGGGPRARTPAGDGSVADNGPGTPADEGLSYIAQDGKRVLLREAVEVMGDTFLGLNPGTAKDDVRRCLAIKHSRSVPVQRIVKHGPARDRHIQHLPIQE